MVFIWLFLLADVHLTVHAQEEIDFSLYGLKLEYNQTRGLPEEKAYKTIYEKGDQIQDSLPLFTGEDYNVILFGKDISNRSFVLTTHNGVAGTNCNPLGTTIEFEPTTKQTTNGVTYTNGEIGSVKVSGATSLQYGFEGRYFLCFQKDENEYIHVGNETFQAFYFIKKQQRTILPIPMQIACISVLLCLSGTFSGLNLGLMALDPQQLKILQTAGSSNEQKYARAVLPVRQYGNFLLCTLLLGNVLVNNTLTIFLDDLTSGLVAIIGSTVAIVIFGEIVPQAICSRHGLYIGYRTLPLTYFFMGITGLLSWPLGKLLDLVLGDEIGMVYNRHRFLEIIKQAQNDLEDDEKQMIEGALKLNEKTVKEVMTQINYVFTVCEDSIIDYDFMQKITDAGYSRIPVRKKEPKKDSGDIIGLLFLRDLVMVDPDDRIEVSTVTNYYKHQLKKIDEDTKLDDMLEIFKNGAYHLSLVTRQIEIGGGKTQIEEVGIITLEDIIEEIICDEIVDETDKYINNKSREKNTKREKMDPEFNNVLRNAGNQPGNQNGNQNLYNPDNLEEVSRNQIAALHRFLVAEVEPFASHKVSDNQLRNILNRPENLIYVKRNDDTKPLFEKGKPMSCFIIIIEGKAEVRFGHDAEMPIEVGPFRAFGIAAMDVKTTHFGGILPIKCTNKGSQSIPNGVLNIEASQSRLSDLDRGGSCPPSAVTTPATTPIGAQHSHICDYTVTITSDEFIYAKITRTDYRNMRNQMEIRNAQKVSSMERLNKTSEMSIAVDRGLHMDSGFEHKPENTNQSDVTVSSDAICQSEFTEEREKLIPKKRNEKSKSESEKKIK